MVLQTRMESGAAGSGQAKVMQFMPYVFSIFFSSSPLTGALLLVTHSSIAQQWQISACSTRQTCPCQAMM